MVHIRLPENGSQRRPQYVLKHFSNGNVRSGSFSTIRTAFPRVPLEMIPGAHTYSWFPALRCRSRIRFRKNRVRTCRFVCRCWGVCAAVARQAREAGCRVSRANEWAELQARTNGRYEK